ncbi:hypothetical protein [Actinoplanes missouriensis]|uniref:hypothetical protein n=1 Tax=Actinoplanes missouriensis TaxID=1866 RepID=UPI00059FEAA4|nr:hypothetical protein [Actinoplanes missouriensis]
MSDDELARELRDLGRALRVPPAIDQREAVRARLAQPAPRPRRVRLAIAACLAALIASVAFVAPARAAVVQVVGDLLRVAGIEVRAEHPSRPIPPDASPLPSSRTIGLREARRLAGFPLVTPAALGEPEEVVLADRVVTMLYRGGTVRFDQFDGTLEGGFLKTTPNAEWVDLGSVAPVAIWLPEPHPLTYVDRDQVAHTEATRLAGPSLVWSSAQNLTYRLEGLGTLEEATEVARSVQ